MPTPRRLSRQENEQLALWLRREPHDTTAVQKLLTEKLGIPSTMLSGSSATPIIAAVRDAVEEGAAGASVKNALKIWYDIPPGTWNRSFQTTHCDIFFRPGLTAAEAADPNADEQLVLTTTDRTVPSARDAFLTAGASTTYFGSLPPVQPRVLGYVDPSVVDANGDTAPTYVQQLGLVLEEAWSIFAGAGFRMPTRRLQLYLIAPSVTGSTFGAGGFAYTVDDVILLHPRCSVPMSLIATTAHEFFHVIQNQYLRTMLRQPFDDFWCEGTAKLAGLNVDGVTATWTAVPKCTPLASASYDGVLFWRYIGEQLTSFRGSDLGPMGRDVIRRAWELVEKNQNYELSSIDSLVHEFAPTGVSFSGMQMARGNVLLSNETVWANWHIAQYVTSPKFTPCVADSRFCYRELLNLLSPRTQPVARHQGAATFAATLDSWDFAIHEFSNLGSAPAFSVAVSVTGAAPSQPVCVQIAIFNTIGDLIDLLRPIAGGIDRVICARYGSDSNASTVGKIVVFLATTGAPATFTCNGADTTIAGDLMITRWNSPEGREYQTDWHSHRWNNTSPDIWLEKAPTGHSGPIKATPPTHTLKVRVRNKGQKDITEARIFASSSLVGGLGVASKATTLGATQLVRVRANQSAIASIPVALPPLAPLPIVRGPLAKPRYLRIAAKVVAPADTSPDNNEAFSDFLLAQP